MYSFSNKAALLAHSTALASPTPADVAPPEQAIIESALAALPEGPYGVIDTEVHSIPDWLAMLPTTKVGEWAGTAEGSWGYGGIELLATRYGPGLNIWLGGSSLQSAGGYYVLPLAGCTRVGLVAE